MSFLHMAPVFNAAVYTCGKTRIIGLYQVMKIFYNVLNRFDTTALRDGRTNDRQTDGKTDVQSNFAQQSRCPHSCGAPQKLTVIRWL